MGDSSLSKSNGFTTYSVELSYFKSLRGLNPPSQKALGPPLAIPTYHVGYEGSISMNTIYLTFANTCSGFSPIIGESFIGEVPKSRSAR